MAPRLTVIISQASVRDSAIAGLEEQVIAELLMSNGMDANLVGPLETMQADSTDWLCLSGFRGSLAVVSWLPTDQVASHWARLSLPGRVRKFGEQNTVSGQSIIHIPITGELKLVDVTSCLKRLLADRSVKTVGIGLPTQLANSKLSATRLPSPSEQASDEKSSIRAANTPRSEGRELPPANAGQAVPTTGKAQAAEPMGIGSYDEEDWPSLDKLVDDFDALDL